MLTLTLLKTETDPEFELHLEHSLVSLSKWEEIHEKVFFDRGEKTEEESLSYIKCMVLDESYPKNLLERLSIEDVQSIHTYINGKHTATTFREDQSKPNNQVITSELVYSWMIQFNIDISCQVWNFNRLMTLIKICGLQQTKPKKMTKAEAAAHQRSLNEQRRRELNSNG